MGGLEFVFTHTKRSPAAKEMVMLGVCRQSLLTTIYTSTAGDPDLAEERRDHDLMLGYLRHCNRAPIVVSVSGRTLFWFTCNYEDHPVTRRDESDITAIELAALHHEFVVDPLR